MATMKLSAADPPPQPSRFFSYAANIPKPPPPTPIAEPTAETLETGSFTLSNQTTTSLPNISETADISSNDQITTHVLNQTTGKPAAGLRASLTCVAGAQHDATKGERLPATFGGMTDSNGRILDWYTEGDPMSMLLDEHANTGHGSKQVWILSLESEDYWQILGKETFLPQVEIIFYIDAATEGGSRGHWHIPVLLGQWGYTTYRGS